MYDDLCETIGSYSMYPAYDSIRRKLLEVTGKYGPAVLAGHSLGGALCQLIAAEFCHFTVSTGRSIIHQVHMFNAPGIGSELADTYKAKIKKLEKHLRPKVYHFRHIHDIVSLGGGKHIKVNSHWDLDAWRLPWKPSLMLTEIFLAHSRVTFISNYEIRKKVNKIISLPRKLIQFLLELHRQTFGSLGRFVIAPEMYQKNIFHLNRERMRRFILEV